MSNIVFHDHLIKQADRKKLNGHNALVLWFTGLSGSGKSTLASQLEVFLHQKGISTYTLDGDNVRSGLNKDLNFSLEDRKENIRRVSEVAHLMVDAGLVVISAFISPLRADREQARSVIGSQNFVEVHIDCPLEVCESRDVKGLYAKARKGLIPDFTGITSPFEAPEQAEVVVNTAENSLEDSLEILTKQIYPRIKIEE